MSKILVAIADTVFPNWEPAEKVLADLNVSLERSENPSKEAILSVAQNAEALFVTYAQITAEVINGLEKCKVIGRFGVGTDNIDIEAATKAGIVVTYAPLYCLDEVSDHAMTTLLALARKIPFSNQMVHNGRWEMPAVVPIRRLKGRTLGLVGLGNIAQAVVGKAQAFGIKTIAAYAPDDLFTKMNTQKVELEELYEKSDYISVHAPLTPETQNMFSTDAFRKMKNDALLINTSRGPLVDTDALVEALNKGEIGGAALDVLPQEPPPENSPLFGREDLILTPHTGFYSEDALLDLQTTVAKDVAAVLNGEQPRFPVNPDVFKT
jgi:D-3-phosphoglycerate dehydrogenase